MYVPYFPALWLVDGEEPLVFEENSERDEDALPESGSLAFGVLGVRNSSLVRSTMLADFGEPEVFRERCIAGGGIRCFVFERLRPEVLEVLATATSGSEASRGLVCE